MSQEIGYYAPTAARRAWVTRDLLLGATALATGMTACILLMMTSPIESALARHYRGDYVLASRVAFWLATVPGAVLGMGGMFLSVSLLARRVPTFGLAKLGVVVALAAICVAAMTLSGSR